ncbi:hypothetical protein Cni_G01056 [Canna indica]|uniref:Uncharacterized protein n=1 Tax=Canna indica TaxID=4628 RepID=A0AAQ3Q0I3_9LILI|nr:hypothetical protein Cni_G01056 [Canna indica]
MGNCQCQSADAAAAAVIQHPDGRMETAYWPLSASQVMAANPGHYVTVIITVAQPARSPATSNDHLSQGGRPVRYLKLLGPDDTLQVGHFYRLVSFEDVLREFRTKRRVRLSKLLGKKKEQLRKQCDESNSPSSSSSAVAAEDEEAQEGVDSMESESHGDIGARVTRHGQWRPSLQTISEVANI